MRHACLFVDFQIHLLMGRVVMVFSNKIESSLLRSSAYDTMHLRWQSTLDFSIWLLSGTGTGSGTGAGTGGGSGSGSCSGRGSDSF